MRNGEDVLHLVDANVLIDANRDYYPLEQVPEFWEWLRAQGEHGLVKVPLEVYDEIEAGKDALADWMKQSETRAALRLGEEPDPCLVQRVIREGYLDVNGDGLNEDEVAQIGRDPFLVAYALVEPNARCVVTGETPKPSKRRQNRKLPDACDNLGITWKDKFQLTKDLRFSTKWKS